MSNRPSYDARGLELYALIPTTLGNEVILLKLVLQSAAARARYVAALPAALACDAGRFNNKVSSKESLTIEVA